MSKIKQYNIEKYSVLDIKEHIEKKGYKTKIIPEERKKAQKLHILDTDIYVDYPYKFSNRADAYLRFEDYPKTENYENSKKLYEGLKRKFGAKDEEVFIKIKDEEKIYVRDIVKIREEREKEEKGGGEKWYKFW